MKPGEAKGFGTCVRAEIHANKFGVANPYILMLDDGSFAWALRETCEPGALVTVHGPGPQSVWSVTFGTKPRKPRGQSAREILAERARGAK